MLGTNQTVRPTAAAAAAAARQVVTSTNRLCMLVLHIHTSAASNTAFDLLWCLEQYSKDTLRVQPVIAPSVAVLHCRNSHTLWSFQLLYISGTCHGSKFSNMVMVMSGASCSVDHSVYIAQMLCGAFVILASTRHQMLCMRCWV
jgi:hypothetical protein